MKILNLYSGIGGNRRSWGGDYEITAVELNPGLAKIYQDLFPKDRVITGDAHQYLLDHYKEFDFIWSSPPCPTHSRMNYLHKVKGVKLRYPDMKLYEEIIFLEHFFEGKWIVENVISYYRPLIPPKEIQRHYFWTNFSISQFSGKAERVRKDRGETADKKAMERGIVINDWHGFKGDKRTIFNNMIEPDLGKHILDNAICPVNPQLVL